MAAKKKEKIKPKNIYNLGGGGGSNSVDTNEGTTETKGDKKKTKSGSTNLQSKDYFHEQK